MEQNRLQWVQVTPSFLIVKSHLRYAASHDFTRLVAERRQLIGCPMTSGNRAEQRQRSRQVAPYFRLRLVEQPTTPFLLVSTPLV